MQAISKQSKCPCCWSKPLSEDQQPEWGTHAFSRKFKCGSQVVYILEGGYWEWETECPELKITTNEISDGK